MRWMSRAVVAGMIAGLALVGLPGMTVAKPDQPEFTVVSAEEDFEIRDYSAIVVAQFTMRGTYSRSVSDGYINLERYFLGENTVPERIDLTVPVMVRDDLAAGWTTMFVLPRGYRQHSAPAPLDQRVRVVEIPARRVAVVKFGGKLNELVMREQVERLDAWLAARGIAHLGDFTLAGYDQSWVPGKWRGNEVLVSLK